MDPGRRPPGHSRCQAGPAPTTMFRLTPQGPPRAQPPYRFAWPTRRAWPWAPGANPAIGTRRGARGGQRQGAKKSFTVAAALKAFTSPPDKWPIYGLVRRNRTIRALHQTAALGSVGRRRGGAFFPSVGQIPSRAVPRDPPADRDPGVHRGSWFDLVGKNRRRPPQRLGFRPLPRPWNG